MEARRHVQLTQLRQTCRRDGRCRIEEPRRISIDCGVYLSDQGTAVHGAGINKADLTVGQDNGPLAGALDKPFFLEAAVIQIVAIAELEAKVVP